MTVLPIVGRELRVAARRRSTYWLRTGAALLVMVIGTWVFLMMQRESPQQIAQVLFGILTGGAVLYALLSGIRSTADCLSEEKREGTLGLLFLTDLKGYDVVFGKLAATSLSAFYGVLAVMPMLAVPLLLGGLTPGEFGRMALVAVNALFFSLAAGIFVSAQSRSAQRAVSATLVLLLGFAAVLPAVAGLLASLGTISPAFRQALSLFFLPSIGYTYYLAWDAAYRAGAQQFWWSMFVIHGLSWAFLVLASLVVPHTWQDKPAGVQRLRWRERWQNWSFGTLSERSAFRRRLLDENAFFWLAARARLKPAAVWALLGLTACGWAWGLAKFRRDWLNEGMYLTTAMFLNLLLRGWFASEASRQLAEDRKAGTLELLLSTPLTVQDILRGQILALQRQFLGPVMVVLVVEGIFLLATLSDTLAESERAFWICLWLGGMIMLVADLIALFWVGLWQGLTASNANRAMTNSLARILLLPWLGMAGIFLLVVIGSLSGSRDPSWQFLLGWWFVLGIGTDIAFSIWSRNKLLSEFRLAAAQRFSPRSGFWKRWLAGAEVQAGQGRVELPPVIAAEK